MAEMTKIDRDMLAAVADLHKVPEGAYNIRRNGAGVERRSSANIEILTKEDKPGIDIYVRPGTKNESLHIPVILTESGLHDLVYNDFYIGEDADVLIIAGCGIHNCGDQSSQHDGIHSFHIGRGARVRYVEKHYGEGNGSGERILNPVTIVEMDENRFRLAAHHIVFKRSLESVSASALRLQDKAITRIVSVSRDVPAGVGRGDAAIERIVNGGNIHAAGRTLQDNDAVNGDAPLHIRHLRKRRRLRPRFRI